jgi:deazaflavin-dependent oxidoreductase (nitroreductase family)
MTVPETSTMSATVPRRPLQLRLISLAHRVAHRVSGGRLGSLDPATHAPRGKALRVITRVHRSVYRLTGGIIGGNAGGLPTLLLTTTGRKSGALRTVPLPYFSPPAAYGDAVIVVASFAGNAKHPEWYLNLVARPEVTVQIGFRRRALRADVATDRERQEIWPALVAQAPMYADYQRVTERTIPVVIFKGMGPRAS